MPDTHPFLGPRGRSVRGVTALTERLLQAQELLSEALVIAGGQETKAGQRSAQSPLPEGYALLSVAVPESLFRELHEEEERTGKPMSLLLTRYVCLGQRLDEKFDQRSAQKRKKKETDRG